MIPPVAMEIGITPMPSFTRWRTACSYDKESIEENGISMSETGSFLSFFLALIRICESVMVRITSASFVCLTDEYLVLSKETSSAREADGSTEQMMHNMTAH